MKGSPLCAVQKLYMSANRITSLEEATRCMPWLFEHFPCGSCDVCRGLLSEQALQEQFQKAQDRGEEKRDYLYEGRRIHVTLKYNKREKPCKSEIDTIARLYDVPSFHILTPFGMNGEETHRIVVVLNKN